MIGKDLKVCNKFISDFDQIDWEQTLYNKKNVDFSMNRYLSKIDSTLEIHVPFKKLNKKEQKFLTKPLITKSLKILLKRKTIYTQNL